MSSSIITFTPEIDSLNEAENIAKTTFHQHCREMIKDIIAYSPDSCGELLKLKTQMNRLAQSQKEIEGLIYGINEINTLTGKADLTEEEAATKFEEFVEEFVEENDIDEEQKELIYSLDSFINDEQETEIGNEESDVLVTKATQSYIDPLTQRTMVDPVKSKICGHAYERESIMKYLSESRKKCPHSGCQSDVGKRDLVDHFVLKMRLTLKEEPKDG